MITKKHLTYSDYPIEFYFARFSAKTAEKISWNNSPNLDDIFLYNDGCIPTVSSKNTQEYFIRLSHLLKLKTKEMDD